jgi:hypothetical protein
MNKNTAINAQNKLGIAFQENRRKRGQNYQKIVIITLTPGCVGHNRQPEGPEDRARAAEPRVQPEGGASVVLVPIL